MAPDLSPKLPNSDTQTVVASQRGLGSRRALGGAAAKDDGLDL
ncbi:hypothetical protein TIFTF001_019849 [Ficus carica]|uniref:Uncharacterized protein n=1 Tax=Ficus carica TaxID=3494 RepID=A0AA88A7F2_FICCA|nr:hypothetical protein TIFTF001_019849 [Ficus carica]